MTGKNYRKKLYGILILIMSLLVGCSGKQGNQTPDADEPPQETGKIIEDIQVYILLNCNPETGKLFLEGVDEGRQEKFEYNENTVVLDREGAAVSPEELKPGELLQIAYTEEQLLKDVRVSRDTFLLDGITDFQIDTQQDTITADGIRYDYDENLKIFSEEELIPINRLSDGATICIRGQESRILTMVASGPEDSDDGPGETGFWN